MVVVNEQVTGRPVCLKIQTKKDALSDSCCGSNTWPLRALCTALGKCCGLPICCKWQICLEVKVGLPVCPNSWRYTRMGKAWKKLVRKNKYHRSLLVSAGKEPAGRLLPKEQRRDLLQGPALKNTTAWSSSNFLPCTLPWSRNKISFVCVSLSNNTLPVFLNTRHTLVLAFGPETWYLLVFTSPVITVLSLLST